MPTSPASASWFCVPVSHLPGKRAAGRPDAVRGQPLEELAPAVEHAEVRREELVRAGHQEVGLQGRDVDRQVRRGVHGIDVGDRADGVRRLDHAADVGDRSERVRGEPDGDDLRPRRQDVVEAIEVERGSVLGELEPPDGRAAILGDRQPRRDVGVMVEPRDHDLVPGVQVAAERAAHREGERRHVRPEGDLVGSWAPTKSAPAAWASSRMRIGLDGRREGAAVVGVAALEVGGDGVDALARHLRAAGSVEVRDRPPVDRCAPAPESGRAPRPRPGRVAHESTSCRPSYAATPLSSPLVTTSFDVPTLSGHDFHLPADLEGLGELAYNLWWSWTPRAQALFARIDSAAWTRHRNPIAVLRYADQAAGPS